MSRKSEAILAKEVLEFLDNLMSEKHTDIWTINSHIDLDGKLGVLNEVALHQAVGAYAAYADVYNHIAEMIGHPGVDDTGWVRKVKIR